MKINKKYVSGILIVFTILLSSYAYAFGVGSAYHKEHPLKISPGETEEIIFNLQNMAGSEDITAKASITEGSEIMTLIDSGEIFIPVGGSVDVKARVSIPDNAKIGEVYPMGITFTTVTKSEAGTFGFGSSVGRNFDVVVIPIVAPVTEELPEEKPVSTRTLGIIITIIVATLVIAMVILKRKKARQTLLKK